MDAEDLELSSSPPTDADLWARLQAGDAKALATIYDRYAGLVYAIALRATRNTQDAEDLVQNIFLQLPKANYDPRRGTLKTFLAIFTRSRTLDWLRSRQRQHRNLEKFQHEASVRMPLEDVSFVDDDSQGRQRTIKMPWPNSPTTSATSCISPTSGV